MKLKCNCKHQEQDKIHGEGRRVHNKILKSKGAQQTYRCTVCGSEKTVGN